MTIYQIAQTGYEDKNISSLLKRYKDESKHINIEVKDPVVNPKFVSDYTNEQISSNSLIVESGERSKIINYSDMYESSWIIILTVTRQLDLMGRVRLQVPLDM